jgi:hypothetical protein
VTTWYKSAAWMFDTFRTLLGAGTAVILTLWIELSLDGETGYYALHAPPARFWDYSLRLFSTFLAVALGSIVGCGNRSLFAFVVGGTFGALDWSRIAMTGIDWHMIEWYPFSFPPLDVVWLISSLFVTCVGMFWGQVGAVSIRERLNAGINQQPTAGSSTPGVSGTVSG